MNVFRSPWRGRPLMLVAVAALTAASPALFSADNELRPDYKPAAYAITGAKIVTGTGATLDAGTVIVRNGVIEAVGKVEDVPVPADAEPIDGKGLVVYPGFIDLYTTLGTPAGVTRSQTGPGRTVPYADFALPRTPPDNRTGLTPEFEVARTLDLPEATADERRKLGFTDILAAPGGPIAAGQSALVSLSGLPRRETLIKTPIALHMLLGRAGGAGFDEGHDDDHLTAYQDPAPAAPAPAVAPAAPAPAPTPGTPPGDPVTTRRGQGGGARPSYPSSLMGIIAHLRQAMLDADYDHQSQEYYEKHGGTRPASDPALHALYSARIKALPTWWEANTRDEIHRVLDLATEFGTTATIVGGRDSAKVLDRLKAMSVPVVLRVDFAAEEPKVPAEAEYRKKDAEGRDVPLKVLEERARRWKERVKTAADLQKGGVKFALVSDGLTRADTFHAQVRKLIAAGLPADAAIEALTKTPAEIAGVSNRLGTIEAGKLGHLVVMTAPYSEELAKPRYVLADGLKFDLEKGTSGAAATKGGGAGRGGARGKGGFAKTAPAKEKDDEEEKPKAEPEKVATPTPAPAVATAPTQPKPDQAPPKAPSDPTAKPKGVEDQPSTPFADVATEFDPDRLPKLKTGGNVLIKDATILTVTKNGTIQPRVDPRPRRQDCRDRHRHRRASGFRGN